MRKCPKCKKAVPVGERRCLYCRAIISEPSNDTEAQESSVRAVNLREDLNGTFSRNNNNLSDQLDNSDRRSGKRQTHQTIFGMGAISANSSRLSFDDEPSDFGQRTIAGMPGISFDALRRAGGPKTDSAPSAQPVEPAPRPESDPEPKQRSSKASLIDASFIEEMSLSLEPTKSSVSSISPAQAPTAPAPAETPSDDPLAGLAGVASVKPSSLVDEEFVDLTSKLFGDTFAQIKEDAEEDDDDGWDFDVPTKTAAPAAAPAASAPAVAPVSPDNEEDAFEDDDELEEAATENAPASASQKIVGYVMTASACIASVCLVAWLLFALSGGANASEGIGIISVAIASIIANIAICVLSKQVKPLIGTAVFGILALLLLLMMIMIPFALDARPILLIAIIFELAATMSSFLKS